MEAVERRTLLSTFTVTNANDTGAGSLRQAILDANKTGAVDTIKFAIGSGAKTISPRSRLPGISQPALLDATTQPGFSGKPLIELNGSSAGGVEGLKITGGGVTIKGFVINRFAGSGIFVYKGSGNNKIVGNWIGVDKTSTLASPNKGHGIICQSKNNTIGGTSAADRNVISGNKNAGVFFYLADGSNNKVVGNYVGTDYTGNKAIKNHNGVQINGANNITVGGTTAGSRNVISGNEHDGGLMVTTGSRNNLVQGNYIGTNAAGTGALGNGWYGVEISQHDNVVGGTTAGARNVISANGYDGVVFYLTTGYNNRCEGNYIGTDYTGTKDLGNKYAGVSATNGAHDNIIGGSTTASRNIISGNNGCGVGIYNGSSRITVQNNRIGICAKGYTMPNSKQAVVIVNGSSGCTIKNNTLATVSGVTPVMVSSGLKSQAGSNTLYANVSAGLKIV
jgi:hypothetical protein